VNTKIHDIALHKRKIRVQSFNATLKTFNECVTPERVGKIANYVQIDGNGCWVCSVNGAHRHFYETFVGDIPEMPRYDVIQTCKNRKCVNPDHLIAIPSGLNPLRIAGVDESRKRRREKREAESFEKRLQAKYNRKAYCDVCQAPMTAYNTLPGGRCRKCVRAELRARAGGVNGSGKASKGIPTTPAPAATVAVAAQAAAVDVASRAAVAAAVQPESEPGQEIEWPAEMMAEVGP
jgi:hypothetical protein